MNLARALRALIITVLVSAVVYAAIVMLSDGPAVAEALRGLDPLLVVGLVGLSTVSYLMRSLRWGALMRLAGHPVRTRDALYLHLSGQTMGISPGRVGEVLKPWLAREVGGLPLGTGIALVFAERVADLIAVCVLALGGLSVLGGGMWALTAALAAIAGATAIGASAWFHRLAIRVLGRQRWARRHADSIASISDAVRESLSWKALAWSVPVSVVAWGLEGVGFWLLLRAVGEQGLSLPATVSVYAVATIVGAFTFLPGGIGITEASMAGVLTALGVPLSAASAVTLVIRAATLWWGVVLGWLVIATRPALFSRLVRSPEADDGVD